MLRLLACLVFLAILAVPTTSPGQAAAPGWGDLHGQVVFGGDAAPAQRVVAAAAGIPICKGTVTEEYVVDAKTGGVKWVFVWLIDPASPKAAIPVHPAVLKALPKAVSFDQPCCTFEPHVLGVVQGQVVDAKNGAPFDHNVKIDGTAGNPELNQVVPSGKSLSIPGWKASNIAVPVSCTIHPWMKMYVRVYAHPYFAVTDAQGNWEIKNAPAGNWNLVVWHEGQGYGPGGKTGVPIVVAAGKKTSAGIAKIN